MRYSESWAKNNNLALNKSKTKGVIFYDSKRRKNTTTPHVRYL